MGGCSSHRKQGAGAFCGGTTTGRTTSLCFVCAHVFLSRVSMHSMHSAILLYRFCPSVRPIPLLCHPPPRLKSRKPIWSDMTPVDVASKCKEDWQSNSVTNKNLISDPTIRLPGFNLRRSTWSTLNRFRTAWTGPLCCQSTQMAHGPYG